MLKDEEIAFMQYWEKRRTKEKTWVWQLLTGLPIGLLFSLPIILILLSGRYWHKRADMVANTSLSTGLLIVAVLSIAVFTAMIYKRHRWEMKEQQYRELEAKQKRNS